MSQAEKPLVNRVASSGLITIKPEDFYPVEKILSFDLKDYLFKELILREKDFRTAMKEHDWAQYEGKVLCVFSSTDAIIPVWAYMLVATYATPFAAEVYQGTKENFVEFTILQSIDKKIAAKDYEDQRVVIKGCSDHPVPPSAYLLLAKKLQPVAKSIMYGEPCSTVPIYKKKK